MKTNGSIVKKWLVLSLLVVYTFILLTYISYLPQYNTLWPKYSGASIFARVRKESGTNNAKVLLHRVFKSVTENKRDTVIFLVKAETLVFSMVFASLALYSLRYKPGIYLKYFFPHQYSYLNFCSLRI